MSIAKRKYVSLYVHSNRFAYRLDTISTVPVSFCQCCTLDTVFTILLTLPRDCLLHPFQQRRCVSTSGNNLPGTLCGGTMDTSTLVHSFALGGGCVCVCMTGFWLLWLYCGTDRALLHEYCSFDCTKELNSFSCCCFTPSFFFFLLIWEYQSLWERNLKIKSFLSYCFRGCAFLGQQPDPFALYSQSPGV